MRRALLLALSLLLWPLLAPPAGAAADETSAALAALESPAERVRQAAVEDLVALLPESRERVVAALADAGPELRLHLVEVLSQDDAPTSIRALLTTLAEADDRLASRIQLVLARSEEASRGVLHAWAEHPELKAGPGGKPSPRMARLEHLLRRAEVETLFLSRKSKTGSTGSYRGQFALLEPYRKEAIDLFVDILLDRAPQVPGVYRVGKFSFLRVPTAAWDYDDIQPMAAHGFAELGTPEDRIALLHLKRLMHTIKIALGRMPDGAWGLSLEDETHYLLLFGRYSNLVVALYAVQPNVFEDLLDKHLEEIGSWRYQGIIRSPVAETAIVRLRARRYEEAVDAYETLVFDQQVDISRSMTHYNLACAYAQWALETEEGPTRERRFQKALSNLRKSVDLQWSDVGWLDEDRDLDPIRDRPAFKSIRAEMVRQITPPDDE